VSHAATSDGTRIAYRTSDSGAPLLLSGQASSHLWWTRVRAEFDAYRHVVTLDYRGTRLHLIAGARHAYFEECRDEAGTSVRDFLTATS